MMTSMMTLQGMHAPRAWPIDYAEEGRCNAQISKLARVDAGHGQHVVESPAYRIEGPMWRIMDEHGNFLKYADRRHPVGPGRKLRLPADVNETL